MTGLVTVVAVHGLESRRIDICNSCHLLMCVVGILLRNSHQRWLGRLLSIDRWDHLLDLWRRDDRRMELSHHHRRRDDLVDRSFLIVGFWNRLSLPSCRALQNLVDIFLDLISVGSSK